jgi:AcrR family transcriptional regulator
MTSSVTHNDNQDDLFNNAKRQQILDGARRCFLAQGFDAASMNEIVKTAGVSKGTIYAYFPSKEKLFEALIFQDRRKQAEQTVVIEDDARAIRLVLHDLGLRLGQMYKSPDSVAYTRMVVAAAGKFPEIGRTFYQAGPAFAIGKVAAYLQAKMEDGTLRMADPEFAAMQYLELMQCSLVKPQFFMLGDTVKTYEIETVVKNGLDVFLRGYLQPVDSGQK